MKKFVAKNGEVFIFRVPRQNDEKACLEFINELIDEGAPIALDRKITLREERMWLKRQIWEIREKRLIMLIAERNGEIVAICEARRKTGRIRHVADFGISVRKKCRGMGVGEAIAGEVLMRAKRAGIKIVRLCVFERNKPAINLYRKLGFVEEAVLKGEVREGMKFKNAILMSLYFS
jgi:ribosomal protein S18 acetylase RimI-like enzyme